MNAGAFLLSAVIVGCSVYTGSSIALAHEGHDHGLEATVHSVTSVENSNPDATADYWTDDRMRAAKPLPIPADGSINVGADANIGVGTNLTTAAPDEPVEAYSSTTVEASANGEVDAPQTASDDVAPENANSNEEVGFFAGIYLSIKSWLGF